MRLVMVGLSHHTAPVEVRERLAFTTPGALAPALDFFKGAIGPGGECALVSTCNRTELYVVPPTGEDVRAEDLPVLLAGARA
jgi:glutamyl-tRNA reductase